MPGVKLKSRGKWRKVASQEIFSTHYFQMRVDQCRLPDGRVMPRYFVVDFPDWVQVVALNRQNDLLLVEQYRYPGKGWYLEFPGGSTHPNRKERPLTAAKRELREETGCVAKKWKYLGYHYPNPALLTNKCHVFLALECTRIGDLKLDPFEDLYVRTLPISRFLPLLYRSKKIHSLMLASFEMARPYLERR